METILIVPDCHHPFCDMHAWALLLQVAKSIRPQHTIILGDFADFYQVSSHSKDPARRLCFADEAALVRTALAALTKVAGPKRTYIAGNHEDRLDRYIQDRSSQLHGFISVPKILGLQDLGWNYIPHKQYYKLGKVYYTHDTDTAGRDAHHRAQAVFQDNICIGHTHRLGYAVVGNAKNKPHVATMLGWLGDSTQADYMHRIMAQRDWALGFGVGYMDPKTGNTHIQPVPIVENSCVVAGKYYKV